MISLSLILSLRTPIPNIFHSSATSLPNSLYSIQPSRHVLRGPLSEQPSAFPVLKIQDTYVYLANNSHRFESVNLLHALQPFLDLSVSMRKTHTCIYIYMYTRSWAPSLVTRARIEAKGREQTHQSYQSRLGRPFSETCQVNSRWGRVGSPLASQPSGDSRNLANLRPFHPRLEEKLGVKLVLRARTFKSGFLLVRFLHDFENLDNLSRFRGWIAEETIAC